MQYNLKEKIKATPEFLDELILKSWQEAEALQQQIVNIDTSSKLGVEVTKLLNNLCTSYYVLTGCLETLAENPNTDLITTEIETKSEAVPVTLKAEPLSEPVKVPHDTVSQEKPADDAVEPDINFEPFEYFVDFDEPSGEPLSDKDLYG